MSDSYIDPANGFLCYNIEPDELQDALAVYKNRGAKTSLNSRTINVGEVHRVGGIIAERFYQRHMGTKAKYVGDVGASPYDFVVDTPVGEKRVDVKCSTRNVAPRPTFEAVINSYQVSKTFSSVTDYAFLCVERTFARIWFCGYISKKEFLNIATFAPKGSMAENNILVKEDCWKLHYEYLNKYER